ncbi:MAG: four helix bundle protein [Deltaproteobacteria bacterium]
MKRRNSRAKDRRRSLSRLLRREGGMNPTKNSTYRFVALDVALEMIRQLREPLAKIRTHDADLAKQIRKAAASVPLNVAEGSRRAGGDRAYAFRVALGSADEVRAALMCADAWGYAAADEELLATLDRLMGLIWGLGGRR